MKCDRGQTEVLTENTVPALLRLPQIPKGMVWDRTTGHAVRGRRPSAFLCHTGISTLFRLFYHNISYPLCSETYPTVTTLVPSQTLFHCIQNFKIYEANVFEFCVQVVFEHFVYKMLCSNILCTSCVLTVYPEMYEGFHAKRLLLFESKRDLNASINSAIQDVRSCGI